MDVLRQKLEDYTVPPPFNAWAGIEERLGDGVEHHLRNQLSHVEVTPPQHVWTSLENKLYTDSDSAETARPKVLRMGWLRIAAALILFLAGGWWVARYVSNGNDTTTALQTPKPNTQVPSAVNEADTAKKESLAPPQTANTGKGTRYVTVAKGGKTVRRSKKLQPLFDCAQLEKPDAVADCRKNLLDLQRKMASSSINATSDFAGLLDAIKTLEENR